MMDFIEHKLYLNITDNKYIKFFNTLNLNTLIFFFLMGIQIMWDVRLWKHRVPMMVLWGVGHTQTTQSFYLSTLDYKRPVESVVIFELLPDIWTASNTVSDTLKLRHLLNSSVEWVDFCLTQLINSNLQTNFAFLYLCI